jgi:FlaA1/EpsC-like NDP-sugar epimerase
MRVPAAMLSWRAALHRLGQVAVDVGLLFAAYWLAFYFRFDGSVPGRFEETLSATIFVVVGLKMAVFVAARFYTKWWRFTSMRDLQAIVLAVAVSSILVAAVLAWWQPDGVEPVPRGVLVFDFLFTLVLIGGVRFLVRSIVERPPRSEFFRKGKGVLIVGAGNAGTSLLRDMQRHRGQLGLTPVGLVDDDPRKRGLRMHGARVLGTREDLPRILRDRVVNEVVIAMPSAPGAARQDVVEKCRDAGVRCTTLPGLPELMRGEVTVSQLREVRVEDVLGRAPIVIDLATVARYLSGRTVLVTGAGGSIGSELCRQISALGVRSLVMVEHSENNLFEIDHALRARGETELRPIVGDCKDEAHMARVLSEHRPEIVFHAAAYKHVPMMELNPLQAVANNAIATEVMARQSLAHGVERFCLISTDKAVEPKTIMGATKALAERIIEMHGSDTGTRFAAVRFGNVLGSSGSVLPIFRRQIAAGGPVTVTHPEMTRFFMTIPEAVQLVIEATGIAKGGDIFVLDMGEPVKIVDLAKRMIELSATGAEDEVDIQFVGIRPGEKLHEELFNLDEDVLSTRFGKIMRATRPPLDPSRVRAGLAELERIVTEGSQHRVHEVLMQDTLAGRYEPVQGESNVNESTISEGDTRP